MSIAFHTDVEVDGVTAPALFDIDRRTREIELVTLHLGKLQLSRSQVCDWIGREEVCDLEEIVYRDWRVS